MKVTIRDERALRAVDPISVQLYLSSRGWIEGTPHSIRGLSVWIKPRAQGHEVAVPISRDYVDYGRLISDLIYNLEIFEERSKIEILYDLYETKFDTFRLSPAGLATADGTIDLAIGSNLLGAAATAVESAAVCAVAPRAHYGRIPKEAETYLQGVRLGQTEHGSYVMKVLSPIGDRAMQADFGLGADTPLARRVGITFMTSLKSAQLAAASARSHGTLDAFDHYVRFGVTSKLCSALSMALDGPKSLEVRARWSPTVAMRHSITDAVVVSAAFKDILSEASEHLRQRSQDESAIVVEGMIRELVRRPDERLGRVKIYERLGESWRVYYTSLDSNEYEIALEAHRDRDPIHVEGVLRREQGRSWIESPTNVAIVRIDDANS